MELDHRSQALKTWLTSGGLIVSTSSLGTGVNYPQIVRVLHAGAPYGMIDFAQESGRAGRQGELVDSVVLVESEQSGQARPLVPPSTDNSWRSLDEGAMQNFIDAGQGACRRSILSYYLDGQPAICTEISAVNCDLCGEGQPELTASIQREAKEEARIHEVLQELVGSCPICWVAGRQNWVDHSHAECDQLSEQPALTVENCDNFRAHFLQWTLATHTCYKCGLSQHFCATGKESTKKC